jgi:serine phosphatase RsbU (regulator of sigma subunit)
VGGDWYDVFALPSGAVCVVVGDVVGRGLPAAVDMSWLRHALRAYTLETADPADVLDRLNRQVRHFEPEVMATVLCAVVDPLAEHMRLSTAGHPPPMISVGPGLPAAILDLPADAPIGVTSSGRRHTSTVALPPGTAVCLYTDGLVERRRRSLDDGLDRLAHAMFAGPAESVCATIMHELVGSDPPADDIALLVLRRQPSPETDGDTLELELPAAPGSLKPLRSDTGTRVRIRRTTEEGVPR